MTSIIEIERVQLAKKSGGDKYEGTTDSGEVFTPYIPQSISRKDGKKVVKFKVTLEAIEFD
ncbi:MAG: hypothetical protein ACOC33_01900 [bacterium]